LLFETRHINFFYGDVQVLFDITLGIEEGEIVSIVGSNAAGKSTIIRTISGILRAKSGSIVFEGRSIENASADQVVDLGIVQVPEGRQLFPGMTVSENLEMGSFIPKARLKRTENLKKVHQIFPVLASRSKQLAGTLSGGEQQMLAVARALMSCPKLLMLDEPSLGLSPLMTQEIFRVVKEINEDGESILLVEQNVRQALNLSARGYVLENGHVVLEGKGTELLKDENVKKAYLGI
jgi:branched-chain amino acid transport system ATP-binding protein